jgi:hypothetical protein
VEYGELLIMPANGRWDLIRRLKVNQVMSTPEKHLIPVPRRPQNCDTWCTFHSFLDESEEVAAVVSVGESYSMSPA